MTWYKLSTADGIVSLATSVCALSFVKFIFLFLGLTGLLKYFVLQTN